MNITKNDSDYYIEDRIVPRFLRYVRYCTTSIHDREETPSSLGQWDLARALQTELLDLGLTDSTLTEHCYLIARIPASRGKESCPAIGFLAHIDTASDVSGENVQPQLVRNYDGQAITLKDGVILDPALDEALAAQKGKDFIHADGTTLLGADDKAGVAVLMGALEYLTAHPEIGHGPLEFIFSPDEETGKGLPEFPLETIKAKACYTLDGGPEGELEIECFNAWKADLTFHGKVIHVGKARGILANAALMAATYAVMLPRSESPEATDGYYGYYCPMKINGNLETAALEVYIRDFDRQNGERRVAVLETFAKAIEAQFPGGIVELHTKLQYTNMKDAINKHPEVFNKLLAAAAELGITVKQKPIRGGTDGSRLSQLGIPTPNIFTGGRNFHSRLEWVSIPEMLTACKLVIELIKLWGEI
ncbi:peptidase T [Breznakiellaceae bacterium SP9]